MNKRSYIAWIILIAWALVIKVFSYSAEVVEHYYSTGIYPYIARAQRALFGWIPFSIGDIFYLISGAWLLVSLIMLIRKLVRKEMTRLLLISLVKRTLFILLIIYVVFNLLWGLNYNRIPMAQRFGLKMAAYSTNDLAGLIGILTDSLNAIDAAGIKDKNVLKKKKTIFNEATDAYETVAKSLPELTYHIKSVKPSLYSYAGNYLGFSGYYNPFSGEAQVNTTVPAFVQPFVTCHEIGHQLGYAKEDEANFAGFLSAGASPSDVFRYSLYFDMYSYARREMYLRDSVRMRTLHEKLRPGVKEDFQTLRLFYLKYKNPIEPVIRKLYAEYLKANQQPKGIMSYDEVVAMLIAYYRTKGILPG